MNFFDITAVLITLAASFGYLNFRFLRLPATTGILSIALLSSLLLPAADRILPGWHLETALNRFLTGIDFNQVLMHGMLCFLLFAGALHVQFEDLKANKWTIILLATLGVLLSTALVGALAYGLLWAAGRSVPLPLCLLFGALISPTDPIAVMGLLKELRAPRDLEAIIAGESLFNDGVGVVLFFSLVSLVAVEKGTSALPFDVLQAAWIFFREIGGGILLGLGLGYLAFRMLKSIDYHQLELLITLALVMFTYSLSFRLEVSGPISVVVAGLLIGNPGKRLAMSPRTVGHVDAFWGMVDDILNAVLFLLIGLEVFGKGFQAGLWLTALAAVPIALGSRFLSVLLPVGVLQWNQKQRGIVPILTWGGLRGGLSVAMALSLPDLPQKGLLLSATYGVVIFSVLVQGLTMRRLLRRYGVGKMIL
jgi:Na+:H+ antiporter